MYLQPSIIVFAVIFGSSFCLDKRFKRVINGVPLNGRPTTYTAIRYYGVTSTARASVRFRKFLAAFGDHGDVHCSGSLITPKIFHTACHCVSYSDSNDMSYVKTLFVDHEWENARTIFFGVSLKYGEESMENYYPVLAQKFILHQRCAKIGNSPDGEYIFDYAIMQIPYEWIKADDTTPYPWTEIEYAPQYTIKDIRQFIHYALAQQLVCLTVGFGAYIEYTIEPKSDVLLTGWSVLMPLKLCYTLSRNVGGQRLPLKFFSWICSEVFPRHHQPSGKGDSGGPVTCDNKYFGLVLGTLSTYSLVSPIYYDLFVTAVEYREDLIHSVDDLIGTYRNVEDDHHQPSARVRPRPGFVLKMRDTNVLEMRKAPFLSSQGFTSLATTVTLNMLICVHML